MVAKGYHCRDSQGGNVVCRWGASGGEGFRGWGVVLKEFVLHHLLRGCVIKGGFRGGVSHKNPNVLCLKGATGLGPVEIMYFYGRV